MALQADSALLQLKQLRESVSVMSHCYYPLEHDLGLAFADVVRTDPAGTAVRLTIRLVPDTTGIAVLGNELARRFPSASYLEYLVDLGAEESSLTEPDYAALASCLVTTLCAVGSNLVTLSVSSFRLPVISLRISSTSALLGRLPMLEFLCVSESLDLFIPPADDATSITLGRAMMHAAAATLTSVTLGTRLVRQTPTSVSEAGVIQPLMPTTCLPSLQLLVLRCMVVAPRTNEAPELLPIALIVSRVAPALKMLQLCDLHFTLREIHALLDAAPQLQGLVLSNQGRDGMISITGLSDVLRTPHGLILFQTSFPFAGASPVSTSVLASLLQRMPSVRELCIDGIALYCDEVLQAVATAMPNLRVLVCSGTTESGVLPWRVAARLPSLLPKMHSLVHLGTKNLSADDIMRVLICTPPRQPMLTDIPLSELGVEHPSASPNVWYDDAATTHMAHVLPYYRDAPTADGLSFKGKLSLTAELVAGISQLHSVTYIGLCFADPPSMGSTWRLDPAWFIVGKSAMTALALTSSLIDDEFVRRLADLLYACQAPELSMITLSGGTFDYHLLGLLALLWKRHSSQRSIHWSRTLVVQNHAGRIPRVLPALLNPCYFPSNHPIGPQVPPYLSAFHSSRLERDAAFNLRTQSSQHGPIQDRLYGLHPMADYGSDGPGPMRRPTLLELTASCVYRDKLGIFQHHYQDALPSELQPMHLLAQRLIPCLSCDLLTAEPRVNSVSVRKDDFYNMSLVASAICMLCWHTRFCEEERAMLLKETLDDWFHPQRECVHCQDNGEPRHGEYDCDWYCPVCDYWHEDGQCPGPLEDDDVAGDAL